MSNSTTKRLLLLFIVLLFICPAIPVLAQQGKINVASFQRMESDITARVTAPKRDQNGEVCALIRIVTNVKDLMFEPDALGITARENKTGEIWPAVSLFYMTNSVLCETTSIRTSSRKPPYTKWYSTPVTSRINL